MRIHATNCYQTWDSCELDSPPMIRFKYEIACLVFAEKKYLHRNLKVIT